MKPLAKTQRNYQVQQKTQQSRYQKNPNIIKYSGDWNQNKKAQDFQP